MFERGTITGALLLGYPQWIAIWLGFKVAAGWSSKQTRDPRTINIYLIGTALSIILASVGAVIGARGLSPLLHH